MSSAALSCISAPQTPERSLSIELARRQWLDGEAASGAHVEPWITRSWQRCMAAGHQPRQSVAFNEVSREQRRRTAERNGALACAARPVLERLSRTIVDTRYFAMVTDAEGIVIEVGALPEGTERADRRARDIARIGIDLSEQAVGTTAIGAALSELSPVWLHRGEHFFDDTSIYSCAGAPLFGPEGDCIGMLDLTGIQVTECPELRLLAAMSARNIENALVQQHPCALLLCIHWPGYAPSADTDGLLCIDEEGYVSGANAAARQMLHQPSLRTQAQLHSNDLFALPLSMLFDAARNASAPVEIPLWSGLRVSARARWAGHRPSGESTARSDSIGCTAPRLRDVEAALIRKAVDDARGNVAEAARALGISRATVYRKLWRGKPANVNSPPS